MTIIVMLLLLTIVVSAEDQTTNLQEIEYKQLLIEQNAKTQAFIKQELAQRDAQLEKKIVGMVNENFAFLDQRIDGFIRTATFKFGMAFFSGMVLGGSILLLINNQLRRKRAIKKKLENHNLQEEKMILSGETLIKIQEATETVDELTEDATPKKTTNKTTNDEYKNKQNKKSFSESVISKTIAPMGDKQ